MHVNSGSICIFFFCEKKGKGHKGELEGFSCEGGAWLAVVFMGLNWGFAVLIIIVHRDQREDSFAMNGWEVGKLGW